MLSHSPAPHPVPVLLGLGANLGDRLANLDRALALLAEACGPFERSPVYQTPPWGDIDQPLFLNLVARGHTSLEPPALLAVAKETEREVGRTASRRWGPRVVDVDILAYGETVVDLPDLQIPHPRLQERGFVLVPLAALAPTWRHPTLGKTAAELVAQLPPDETAGITLWQS